MAIVENIQENRGMLLLKSYFHGWHDACDVDHAESENLLD